MLLFLCWIVLSLSGCRWKLDADLALTLPAEFQRGQIWDADGWVHWCYTRRVQEALAEKGGDSGVRDEKASEPSIFYFNLAFFGGNEGWLGGMICCYVSILG